jgi:hypothetical protein
VSHRGQSALEGAGWRTDREVDVAPHRSALVAAGYTVWPALTAFIQAYAGLRITFERNQREDAIWFDPSAAVKWADERSVKAYEQRLGSRLAPVGYAYHDHLLLLASEGGQLFGAYDDFVADLGSTAADAVGNLIEGNVNAPPEQG